MDMIAAGHIKNMPLIGEITNEWLTQMLVLSYNKLTNQTSAASGSSVCSVIKVLREAGCRDVQLRYSLDLCKRS